MKRIREELHELSIPLIVQSVTNLVIGLADEMIVGRISTNAYSAVGVVVSFLYFAAGVLGSLAIAFQIAGSRNRGAGEEGNFLENFTASLLLDILLGSAGAVLILLGGRTLLSNVYGFSGEILDEAMKYLVVMSPYMLVQLLIFTFHSYFKVCKNTKNIMKYSILCTILNIGIDYILVFGKFGMPEMGVVGAALGSMIGLVLNVSIYMWIARKDIRYSFGKRKSYAVLMKRQIRAAIPLMGQEILEESVCSVFLNALIARIGVVELAAYLLGKQILNIALMPMFMYGSSVLTLVSEKAGKRDKKSMEAYPREGSKIALGIYLIAATVCIIFRKNIPRLISEDFRVVDEAASMLVVLLGVNIFHTVYTIYRYALQALDDGKAVLYITALGNFVILVGGCLSSRLSGGMNGIYVSIFLGYLFFTAVYYGRYRRKMRVDGGK